MDDEDDDCLLKACEWAFVVDAVAPATSTGAVGCNEEEEAATPLTPTPGCVAAAMLLLLPLL